MFDCKLYMGRILAIDYGQKRTGLAVTDPLRIIANPLETVRTHDLFSYLEYYFKANDVDEIVVGEPTRWSGEASDIEVQIIAFINRFQKKFPSIPVKRFDESFTSIMAQQSMIDMGLKKKERQNKAMVDTIAATLILQSFMESNKNI